MRGCRKCLKDHRSPEALQRKTSTITIRWAARVSTSISTVEHLLLPTVAPYRHVSSQARLTHQTVATISNSLQNARCKGEMQVLRMLELREREWGWEPLYEGSPPGLFYYGRYKLLNAGIGGGGIYTYHYHIRTISINTPLKLNV